MTTHTTNDLTENGLKELRDYQQECFEFTFRHLTNGKPEVAICGPTGCGKTLTVTYLIERLLNTTRFVSALIMTPQTQILDGFFHTGDDGLRSNFRIKAPPPPKDQKALAVFGDILVDYDTWVTPTSNQWEAVLEHVQANKPSTRVLVTTHQTVATRDPALLSASLKGRVLVIDEAHHASTDNRIGVFAKTWRDRGGAIIHLTATPFRTDKDLLLDESVPRWTRTLAEHLESGFAPRMVMISSEPIPMVARTIDEFAGNKMGLADQAASVQVIFDLLVKEKATKQADPDYKSVVLVPNHGADTWSKALNAKLTAGGFRVFDAVKGGIKTSEELKRVLAAERRAADPKTGHFTQSQYDVILACARFNEGTDWVFCSHIYNIGLTQSFLLILQRLGRGLRPKFWIPGFPERHMNQVKFTFLVPSVSDAVFQEFEQRHKDHAFMTACFMADVDTGSGYLADLTREMDAGRARTGKRRVSSETWADVIQFLKADPQECREAARHMFKAINALQHEGVPKPTNQQVSNFMTDRMKLEGDEFDRAKRLLVYNQMGRSALALQGFLSRLRNKSIRDYDGDPRIIREDMQPMFDEMLAEFGDDLADMDLTAKVIGHMTRFTGRKAADVARSLRSGFGKPQPSDDEITAAILVYHRGGGAIPPAPGAEAGVHFGYAPGIYTWQDVNNRLAVLEQAQ